MYVRNTFILCLCSMSLFYISHIYASFRHKDETLLCYVKYVKECNTCPCQAVNAKTRQDKSALETDAKMNSIVRQQRLQRDSCQVNDFKDLVGCNFIF